MATTDAGTLESSVPDGLPAASGPAAAAAVADDKSRDLSEQLLEILQQPGGAVDTWEMKVNELMLQRQELQKETKRLTVALRNESRKRQRIIKKSMYLSNEDLADVLALRKCKEEKAASVSQARAKGQ